jgi:hypothetical protein
VTEVATTKEKLDEAIEVLVRELYEEARLQGYENRILGKDDIRETLRFHLYRILLGEWIK